MPYVKAIDPDELPQITYAIIYKEKEKKELENTIALSSQEKYIILRQIANSIKSELKTIPNVTTLDIV
jgi:hypothetical protein